QGIPPALEAICLRCLAKKPADRYPTAAALANDLQRYLDEKPIEPRPNAQRSDPPMAPAKNKIWAPASLKGWGCSVSLAIGSLAAVFLLVVGNWVFIDHNREMPLPNSPHSPPEHR